MATSTTTTTKKVTVRDRCGVAPSTAAGDVAAEQILPLTFLDMFWVYFHPIQRLLCFHYPSSTSNFFQTILPNLKYSLSQTLYHYFPLAGNLYHPLDANPALPELRYLAGDSVLLTVSVAGEGFDFGYLTGNQPRNADDFHSLVPDLPESWIDRGLGFEVIPLFAVQVTLFPETGICIGFTNHHVVGDASSIVGFVKAWSSIAGLGNLSHDHSLPFYDRSVVQDPSGRANIFYNQMKQFKNYIAFDLKLPTNRVRVTYSLKKSEIQELRNRVVARSDSLHLSSFTIATAYVWTCLVKSCAPSGELVDDDEPEYFGFAVDARHRIEPPVPAEYFGNCLAFVVVGSKHGILKGEDGFFRAVELVGDIIAKKVNNKVELWRGTDDWIVTYGPLLSKRAFGVAGSPKFDLYETDFGWGKAIKYEVLSIDFEQSMSLCKSPELEGGLEIGMSLPEKKMESFAAAFSGGKSACVDNNDTR